MRSALALGLALLAAPAFAQAPVPGLSTSKPSNTTGFFFQAQLGASSYGGEAFDGLDDESVSGGGIGIGLGYGVSRVVTLFANYDFTGLSNDQLDAANLDLYGGMFDIGVRINFRGERSQLVPYLDLALSGAAVLDENQDGFGGSGLTLGGGVQYFVSETFALRGGLELSGGKYSYLVIDGDQVDLPDGVEKSDFGNARLHLGLSYYPFR